MVMRDIMVMVRSSDMDISGGHRHWRNTTWIYCVCMLLQVTVSPSFQISLDILHTCHSWSYWHSDNGGRGGGGHRTQGGARGGGGTSLIWPGVIGEPETGHQVRAGGVTGVHITPLGPCTVHCAAITLDLTLRHGEFSDTLTWDNAQLRFERLSTQSNKCGVSRFLQGKN